MEYTNHLRILEWAEEDRPREKLLTKGRSSLTDAELIAILIGSGTVSISAVDLAKLILKENNNDLNLLAQLNVNDLKKFKGIGEAKAIAIISALELGRRRKSPSMENKKKIMCSEDAYQLMIPHLMDLPHEEFWIILLNKANVILKSIFISKGGIGGTVADPKIIFKIVLEHLASGVILVHNHPSGNTKPSEADYQLTSKLKQAGNFLDIPVLDHIIFTNQAYYSFADEGKL